MILQWSARTHWIILRQEAFEGVCCAVSDVTVTAQASCLNLWLWTIVFSVAAASDVCIRPAGKLMARR